MQKKIIKIEKFNVMKKILLSVVFVSIALFTFCQLPTSGLVGYWPFNGNANDESNNGNNGTVSGAILTTDRFGNTNSAYSFDGTNDYIVVADNASLKPNRVSISAWVKLNSTSCTKTGGNPDMSSVIFKKNSYNSYFEGYMIGYRTDLNKFHGLASNAEKNATGFSNSVILNTWKHIVVTIDSDTLKFYENGILFQTVLTGFSLNYSNTPLCFGSTQQNYNGYFNGVIDDIGIWNRVLTQDEILALYFLGTCKDTTLNDTTTYYVSNIEFQSKSPKIYYENTDSLITKGGCDSVVNRYIKFEFNPNYCTDTITVEDTLNIQIESSINHYSKNNNEIKIYPNPTKDNLWIECEDYTNMNNYQIKIVTISGSTLWSSYISQQKYNIDISNYSKGLYFIEIYDNTDSKIITKKIVLQ